MDKTILKAHTIIMKQNYDNTDKGDDLCKLNVVFKGYFYSTHLY